MGKQYPHLYSMHQQFIEQQKIFFVATAAPEGRVNVSPKGLDSLRVLSPHQVCWLSVTGSGNETSAHLLQNDRMTLMFCAFEGNPLVLRLYGHARAVYPQDDNWALYAPLFPAHPGTRQIFIMDVDLVQTSCGMAVPYFTYEGDRDDLTVWSSNKGEARLEEYRREKNRSSIDGFPTGLPHAG
jgi:hypothetical protein